MFSVIFICATCQCLKSSEHAYQYCKLRYIDQEELADEILTCDTPRQLG